MARIGNYFLLGIALLSTIACSDEILPKKPVSTSINKILPLGASRVEGARPEFESYRYELWKDLVDNGWTFDYIGTQTDEASYPIHNGKSFDPDHEGRGGWTSGDILDQIAKWLEYTGSPDIVLFSSPGGNDALQGLPYNQTLSHINSIIDVLQNANPNVTIIIEKLAPAHSSYMSGELSDYFYQLQQDVAFVAKNKTTASSRVITADMCTGFTDQMLADDVHYNAAGAAFIADRYYEVLVTILEG
ncbi:MAG: hypothetical protein KKI09_06965 [Spirochaetes bacterium]|nr:hypothetical protein [Spirochaetota bacterium]MBU0955150.1 hypothetical protein [Spirochaetota bacterium]